VLWFLFNSSLIDVRYFTVTPAQFAYLKTVAADLSLADYKLFCYFLLVTITRYREVQKTDKGWLSVRKRVIQDKFRTARPENLQQQDLIAINRSYTVGKNSRRYRVNDWVVEGYVKATIDGQMEEPRYVSIVTGKPVPPKCNVEPDPSKEPPIPQLIQSAMDRFQVCYYDRLAVLEHLERLHATYEQTPTHRDRFRFLNDWLIFDAIEKLSTPADAAGIYRFKPGYKMLKTGRICTPLQSASRAMKAAAYGSLIETYNYDLTSSQMALTMLEFERNGIHCPWIQSYLNEPHKRAEYARFVGVTVDTWKNCLYTILMTGHIPTNTKWQGSPVVETLEDEIKSPVEVAAALSRLRNVLKPLARNLKKWHKRIESEAKESESVTNMLGLIRPVADFNGTPGMVAHLLQGMEACFIHTLTLLGDTYGFVPLGNEHDGLITMGQIPDEAKQAAREITDLYWLELREKPFQ
jgi:hypothetical protein